MICGRKSYVDHKAAEKFIDEFAKVITDENLRPNKSIMLMRHHVLVLLF
jgi:hypothetical protein